jgi:23S rRNA pseudouridine2457 synthase
LRYIIFNKPYGVVSQFSGEPPTLADYIKVPAIYPVGRLDKDSEGLMLLTDDGALQHRFTDPKFEHPRTYWVQVEGVPDTEALKGLKQGVVIPSFGPGLRTRPATVQILNPQPEVPPRDPPIRFRKSIPTTWIEITLIEGKNRQVRKMTAETGYPTLRLIRVAFGNLSLGSLQPGEWKEVPKPAVARHKPPPG